MAGGPQPDSVELQPAHTDEVAQWLLGALDNVRCRTSSAISTVGHG
jgi:hypothetical protein